MELYLFFSFRRNSGLCLPFRKKNPQLKNLGAPTVCQPWQAFQVLAEVELVHKQPLHHQVAAGKAARYSSPSPHIHPAPPSWPSPPPQCYMQLESRPRVHVHSKLSLWERLARKTPGLGMTEPILEVKVNDSWSHVKYIHFVNFCLFGDHFLHLE